MGIVTKRDRIAALRERILAQTRELVELEQESASSFIPGKSTVPYAGRVYDADEVEAGVRSMLDFWLTLGPEGTQFELQLARRLGVRRSVLVNSGSSANLLAVSCMTSFKLGERRLRPGDEVITAAAGFPTTVAPLVQVGAIPVFVDSDPETGNLRTDQLRDAYVEGKTKGVMVAHSLGNPFDLREARRFCDEHALFLIEDNCDALGSIYDGRLTGSFGDLSTQSFYPPHHLTMGEGGAVNIVKGTALVKAVESFRDWGRDCWCPSGKDNTCGKRFDWKMGQLPQGYDHKYVYSHLGYNLKPLDPQAAIGLAQLQKLDDFGRARRRNWTLLRAGLADLEDAVDFSLPTHAKGWSPEGFTWHPGSPKVDPSWFGFMITVKPNSPTSRTALARHLDQAKIGNRMLFGGNLVRQPAFVQLQQDSAGSAFRVVGDLSGADRIMNDSIFVGTYPGLTEAQIEYMISSIRGAFGR